MTAYAFVTLTIDSPDTFAAYREQAGAALAKYQAKPFTMSRETQVIEGDGPAPDVTVVLEFPDRAHALGWINDPELAEIHALRQASGTSHIILL